MILKSSRKLIFFIFFGFVVGEDKEGKDSLKLFLLWCYIILLD